jgi:hypothetical protein
VFPDSDLRHPQRYLGPPLFPSSRPGRRLRAPIDPITGVFIYGVSLLRRTVTWYRGAGRNATSPIVIQLNEKFIKVSGCSRTWRKRSAPTSLRPVTQDSLKYLGQLGNLPRPPPLAAYLPKGQIFANLPVQLKLAPASFAAKHFKPNDISQESRLISIFLIFPFLITITSFPILFFIYHIR